MKCVVCSNPTPYVLSTLFGCTSNCSLEPGTYFSGFHCIKCVLPNLYVKSDYSGCVLNCLSESCKNIMIAKIFL